MVGGVVAYLFLSWYLGYFFREPKAAACFDFNCNRRFGSIVFEWVLYGFKKVTLWITLAKRHPRSCEIIHDKTHDTANAHQHAYYHNKHH